MTQIKTIQSYNIICKKDRSNAILKLKWYDENYFPHEILFPVVSAFVHPKTQKVIRAYCWVPRKKDHWTWWNSLSEYAYGLNASTSIVSNEAFFAYKSGRERFVRVGPLQKIPKYYDSETDQQLEFYDNAATALLKYIEYLETYCAVSGLDLVDFSGVAREFLLQCNAVEIADILNNSPSMWCTDLNKMLQCLQPDRDTSQLGHRYETKMMQAKHHIDHIKSLIC